MTTWILIIAMYRGGVTSIEFPTRQGCEAALAATMDEFQSVNAFGKKIGPDGKAVCVEKK
jgi:hypothetical protein